MYSKGKAKIQEKILGQTDFLRNKMKNDNLKKIQFRLRSNKSTLLIQHDVICGTDNAFPMVKLSKQYHMSMETKSPKQCYSLMIIQLLW